LKNSKNYIPQDVANFCAMVLEKLNMQAKDAKLVADSLVQANLRGVDSHGVARMPIYTERLSRELVDPNPQIEIVKETSATALMNGKCGMGQVVAAKAMEIAIAKAKEAGIGLVGVRNSSHFGTASFFSEMALKEDMIGIAMSNAPATMAPWGARVPYLGTNPFSFAIPTGKEVPIILDMATSVIARGKIILAHQKGEPIEPGLAIDTDGNITTDAEKALEGAVLPFGGPKGSGIALLIDILSGILNGAAFGPHIADLYRNLECKQNVGHLLGAINLNAFAGIIDFKVTIDAMIREIKDLPKAAGVNEIFMPGEIEYRSQKKREQEGIPLGTEVVEELKQLGIKYQVEWIG
jgi:LDH2 family malate/lactate/ureidoglycolate dehydrogenase